MSDKLHMLARIMGNDVIPEVVGRDTLGIQDLIGPGEVGFGSVDGPRWSHYAWKLRTAGFAIDTINESLGGPFAGGRARYILRSRVEILEQRGRAA